MTSDERRIRVATLLRELGHAFVAHDVADDELDRLAVDVANLLERVSAGDQRTVAFEPRTLAAIAEQGANNLTHVHQYLANDSVVAGGANPMGLGARHWREDDVAVMEVVIGRAFEGAPGRSHGGIVATLIDETMGFVLGLHGLIALTARLEVTYRAAVPVDQPVVARAWLEHRDGRKLRIRATVSAAGRVVVDAESLFIAIDPSRFVASSEFD